VFYIVLVHPDFIVQKIQSAISTYKMCALGGLVCAIVIGFAHTNIHMKLVHTHTTESSKIPKG